jgi:DUF4097 and DUF4098 domain-containing protein YvlB
MYGPAMAGSDYQEEINQTYDLAPGSTISVQNINGSVTIDAWDQGRVQLSAVKKGNSKADVDEINVEIARESNGLSIRTIHPKNKNKNGNGASVSYTLLVPRDINLDKIESVNGSIKISGVDGNIQTHTVNGSIKVLNSSGSTNANTVNGSINVELDRVATGKDMKFATVNGSIKVYLPDNISAEVKAKTMNGGIHTDFPLTVQGKFQNKSIDGTLGNGGAQLRLETVNGSISLLKRTRMLS